LRTKIDLNLTTLDKLAVLIHGPYAGGKTHLQGDFLRWGKERGKIAFVNIKGEDGYASIAAMGLGMVAETVESLADFTALVAEYSKAPFAAVAFDSLPALEELVVIDKVGSLRYPDPKLDGERAKMLWGQIKLALKACVIASRTTGKVVLWVASHDKADIAGSSKTAPNLIGKSSGDSIGWFDFVGELQADTKGATNVVRTVSFAPSTGVATRQRVAKTITEKIVIPDGGGGWAAIWKAIENAIPAQEKK